MHMESVVVPAVTNNCHLFMIGEPNSTQDTVSDNPGDTTAETMTPLTDEGVITVLVDDVETEVIPATLAREIELSLTNYIIQEVVLRREISKLRKQLA